MTIHYNRLEFMNNMRYDELKAYNQRLKDDAKKRQEIAKKK